MSDLHIHICTDADQQRWERFVTDHSGCTSYHRWAWKLVFDEVFGWPSTYLLAEERGEVRGILPLVQQKCLLRSYLSSMPHLKGGGIVAESTQVERLLFDSAIVAARQANATYLELRQVHKHDLPLALRQDKVGAVMSIASDGEERLRRLDTKVRNHVRKSLTFGLDSTFGGLELLGEFYRIYRQNMHDLGSPAYSQAFFTEILRRFPSETYICVARLAENEVAAAFMIGFRDTLEVAWSSSYRQFLKLKPNMFLYWKILEFAANRGYKFLDFGRSNRDSGVYEFKMQWGAVPSELPWCYWLNQRAAVPAVRSGGMQIASRMWRRLPVTFTNVLGPTLIKHIPGI